MAYIESRQLLVVLPKSRNVEPRHWLCTHLDIYDHEIHPTTVELLLEYVIQALPQMDS